ncbi:MAG: sulfotransferase family 2 domain-containing protein [Pararhodobacter sp.]|nr:sulfotransferase family 2 domain-containing protein [Pararhodobacter sp.]
MSVILDKHALSYLPVPKAACTSLKTLFFEVQNGFPFRPFSTNGRQWWIHDFYKTIPFEQIDHAAIAEHRRIAVLRDPVRRLLSCYSNRVVHHRELSREKARKPLKRADLPFDPDLPTFIAKLPAYCEAVPSIHHHAMPMVTYLGRDPAYFTRLYPMAELDQLVADMSALAGRELTLEKLQTGGPKIDPESLDAPERARLDDFYAEDYAHYGRYL